MKRWDKRFFALFLAVLLCGCRGSVSDPPAASETEPIPDGIRYEYTTGGRISSAVTYEDGAAVRRAEYDYWPGGSVKTIAFYEADQWIETWNFLYADEGVLSRQVRAYTEDGFACSDLYDYDVAGNVIRVASYEEETLLGAVSYTYNETGTVTYSRQTDPSDAVINETKYDMNADGAQAAGYYFEYGSLSRYWINTYENALLTSVEFYTASDELLSRTVYEYREGRQTRASFFDDAGTLLGYLESLYDEGGVHYRDIYYEDGAPVYGYDYTDGIAVRFAY